MKKPFLQLALPMLALGTLAVSLSLADHHKSDENSAPDTPWENLFDGKTLFGWDGDPALWKVEDGTIVGTTTDENPIKYNSFLTWQGGDLTDFHLKVDYKIENGNSGIQYRSFAIDKPHALGGYQADFEAGDRYSGICYGEKFRGILSDRGNKSELGEDGKPKVIGSVGDSKEIGAQIKKKDWNTYEVIARGHHIIHKINGVVTTELIDNDLSDRRDSGLLGFQIHQGPAMRVSFKNILVQRFKPANKKKIVFMAGHRSHGYDAHEHRAGCLLLANQLNKHSGDEIAAEVRLAKDWPANINALEDADAIVFYCDGGKRHMANSHLEDLDVQLKKGVGLACLHYGVETTKGKAGDKFVEWMGGYFEPHYSVNPHWVADFKELPDHPITRGVKPFSIKDEWYFHMRFVPEMKGVTPILSAHPPESTMARKDGAHSGNPHVREAVKNGEIQHVAWAYERPNGGRGFGFTGGHFHRNWGQDDFRKTVLNAITWVAKVEVPADGVPSDKITDAMLDANQDFPPRKKK